MAEHSRHPSYWIYTILCGVIVGLIILFIGGYFKQNENKNVLDSNINNKNVYSAQGNPAKDTIWIKTIPETLVKIIDTKKSVEPLPNNQQNNGVKPADNNSGTDPDPFLFEKYFGITVQLSNTFRWISVTHENVFFFFKLKTNTHKGNFIWTKNDELYFTDSEEIIKGKTYKFYTITNCTKINKPLQTYNFNNKGEMVPKEILNTINFKIDDLLTIDADKGISYMLKGVYYYADYTDVE